MKPHTTTKAMRRRRFAAACYVQHKASIEYRGNKLWAKKAGQAALARLAGSAIERREEP